jgi:hypothetical protein
MDNNTRSITTSNKNGATNIDNAQASRLHRNTKTLANTKATTTPLDRVSSIAADAVNDRDNIVNCGYEHQQTSNEDQELWSEWRPLKKIASCYRKSLPESPLFAASSATEAAKRTKTTSQCRLNLFLSISIMIILLIVMIAPGELRFH